MVPGTYKCLLHITVPSLDFVFHVISLECKRKQTITIAGFSEIKVVQEFGEVRKKPKASAKPAGQYLLILLDYKDLLGIIP